MSVIETMKKGCIACLFQLWMLPWLLFSLLDFSFDEYCPIFGGKASSCGLRSCSFVSRTVAKTRARIRSKGLAFQSFLFICPSNLSRSVTEVSRFNCKVHLSMSPLWPLPSESLWLRLPYKRASSFQKMDARSTNRLLKVIKATLFDRRL